MYRKAITFMKQSLGSVDLTSNDPQGVGWRATKCIFYGSIRRKSKDKWAGTFIT